MSFDFAHPYHFDPRYSRPVAYFSMEYAIHQPLKIYAGGLGFLAGSHLRSAYVLKQNMVGVGILWKYGYYDQVRNADQTMGVLFQEKIYHFLVDTGIQFTIRIHGQPVQVKAWYLPPETFQTAPLFLLSTDVPENDYLAKTTSHKLYDADLAAQLAADIVLGIGGARLFEYLPWKPEIYHLNESHALPLAFYLYQQHQDLDEVKKRLVFTNHTPEAAGNPQHDYHLLEEMSFFGELTADQVRRITGIDGAVFNHTLAALRMAGVTNGVSEIHTRVLHQMWGQYDRISPICSITNAQHAGYWADAEMYEALQTRDAARLRNRKRQQKQALFEVVADQCGKLFDPDVLTIVIARRFAGYKRLDLLLHKPDAWEALVNNARQPVQLIWAGKPYPADQGAIGLFNHLVHLSKSYRNVAVLTGYELALSKQLKAGADVWLNIPRLTREASGTSGMTAAMNGAINVSTPDGWFAEFARDEENSFVIPAAPPDWSPEQADAHDATQLYDVLTRKVIPTYYENPARWIDVMMNSLRDVIPRFDSNRLADEYYEKLYRPEQYRSAPA
ncbi:alpha-glucan family phosphorylase [Thermoflavifilum thermophilum]|uniref:Starch phosphorylase n=1 Tax=Thermoflavifilum thermophilum TaxID=1393122 RepID=A0A1I7N7Z3_9BACT|nr:alpha-glucan family phosphorylase [Thermoflavifilum thermophilum]SFV30775.1 starch phosphorylase [Thermoflavifilum thermophilum]